MNNNRRDVLLVLGALLLLLLSFFLSLRFGSTQLSAAAFWGGLFGRADAQGATLILRSLRLPRALAGLFAGAGLALSGSLLQHATDNPLAAPNIIGINAGAGFFVILAMALFPTAHALLPFVAFAGALLTALLILSISARVGLDKTALVLCGVAFSALFGAGISFFSVLDADLLASYTDFSVGGLRGVTMRELWVPMAIIVFCFLGALCLSRKLSLFCLGDSLALSLGVSVKRVRLLALALAAASAAAAVSFAGLLGFVGLLVPHMARRLSRNRLKTELLLSPTGGAVLLLLADLVGRVIFTPTEVPVGIFTALLGVPFFVTLLLRRKRHA
ncbi:MAG: iron ABC transporter permease [Ruminococcaceae bacterium]|nr:iron ABC transporter permease [Oscillospiraceae bacterium]